MLYLYVLRVWLLANQYKIRFKNNVLKRDTGHEAMSKVLTLLDSSLWSDDEKQKLHSHVTVWCNWVVDYAFFVIQV